MSSESGDAAAMDAAASFPAGTGEFLVDLALAAHRFAMYPAHDPSLGDAAETAVRAVSRVLKTRGTLAISIRDGRLAVDGAVSDGSHALLADLARRMNDHQLGALVFRRGVTLDEMAGLLDALSRDAYHPESALGLLPVHDRPGWEHVLLQPIGYEFLHPMGAAEGTLSRSATDLWDRLQKEFDRMGEDAGSERIVPLLTRILEELGWDRSDRAMVVCSEVEERLSELPIATLVDLVHEADRSARDTGSDTDPHRPSERLLIAASRTELGLPALSRLTTALSGLSAGPISPMLARTLNRLAELAEEGRGDSTRLEALAAARSVLERKVMLDAKGAPAVGPGRWRSAEPEPGHGGARMGRSLSREEAVRIVEVCLEVDRGGEVLQGALTRLVRSGDLREVIAGLESAPSGSRSAHEIEDLLVTPEQLRLLLSGQDVDAESLRALVDRMGDRALDPLFDRLAGSESRDIRRKVFDRLTAMGERVSGTVMTYLEDPPWFVQRNMLALLQRMPSLPSGFSPLQHLSHEDSRVRREALPLAMRVPGAREEALAKALDDRDERIVRMALLELQEQVPDSVVPVLIENGLRSPRFPELSSLAARALGRSERPEARDALLEACVETPHPKDPGPEVREIRLRPRSPELLAALVSLAEGWPENEEVAAVIRRAREASDPQIRGAVLAADSGVGR